MFDDILGNQPIQQYLIKACKDNTLPHALLFAGLQGVGKRLMAIKLAQALLKTDQKEHPDLCQLSPEGKSGLYAIETLRKAIDQVHQAPFQAPVKVFLLFDAERMQPAAANALLKTLEEPTERTYFFLISDAPSEILPTILSRMTILRFQPLSLEDIKTLLSKHQLDLSLASFAHGSFGQALCFSQRVPVEEELFSLLAKPHSYCDQCIILERLEKALVDEDPVKHKENIEHLLSSMAMWYRDQHVKKHQLSVPLFFQNAPSIQHNLWSLDELHQKLEEMKDALSKNLKFSVAFEALFLKGSF